MTPRHHIVSRPASGYVFNCRCVRCSTGLEGVDRDRTAAAPSDFTWAWGEVAGVLVASLTACAVIGAAIKLWGIIA
jgi:hypothetical protein